MDTLKVLVDGLITQLRPRMKTDQRLEQEFVEDTLHTSRLEVIKDLYTKKQIMDGFYQRVRVRITRDDTKVVLALVSNPNVTAEYDLTDSFFIMPIPATMTGINYASIKYLGGLNFQQPFDRVTLQQFMTQDASPWTENRPKYTVDLSRIYLDKIPLGMAIMEGLVILQNPTELLDYDYETSIYPLPLDFKAKTLYIAKQSLMEHLAIPTDPVNDAIDMTQVRMPKQQPDVQS